MPGQIDRTTTWTPGGIDRKTSDDRLLTRAVYYNVHLISSLSLSLSLFCSFPYFYRRHVEFWTKWGSLSPSMWWSECESIVYSLIIIVRPYVYTKHFLRGETFRKIQVRQRVQIFCANCSRLHSQNLGFRATVSECIEVYIVSCFFGTSLTWTFLAWEFHSCYTLFTRCGLVMTATLSLSLNLINAHSFMYVLLAFISAPTCTFTLTWALLVVWPYCVPCKCIILCRYYEQGGFSTLAVETVDMEIGEVLAKVLRKRRLQMQGVG